MGKKVFRMSVLADKSNLAKIKRLIYFWATIVTLLVLLNLLSNLEKNDLLFFKAIFYEQISIVSMKII